MFRARSSALLALAGCGSSGSATSAAPRIGSALAATIAAADHDHTPWRCSGTRELAADEKLAGDWELAGGALKRTKGELVIGVIADAGGSDPKTLAALGRLHGKLEAEQATLVIALGGMGGTQPELEATLAAVAGTWPVVAVPGDLEPVPAEAAAIAALRARGTLVLDGRRVRTIEGPGATIGVIPGAGSEARLVAGGDGCAWTADDISALYGELSALPGLRIAASAEAPRELAGGEPTGELALVPGDAQPIDLVLHGPTRPAPTPERHGGRDGAHVGLSPGTADATTRLPETRSPAAGLLVIRAGAWAWRPLVDAR